MRMWPNFSHISPNRTSSTKSIFQLCNTNAAHANTHLFLAHERSLSSTIFVTLCNFCNRGVLLLLSLFWILKPLVFRTSAPPIACHLWSLTYPRSSTAHTHVLYRSLLQPTHTFFVLPHRSLLQPTHTFFVLPPAPLRSATTTTASLAPLRSATATTAALRHHHHRFAGSAALHHHHRSAALRHHHHRFAGSAHHGCRL